MNKDENKVFVVTTGEYSDYTIDRVFSTRKKALEYLDTKDDEYTLEVFDLDEPIERKTQIYEISFELDKKKVWNVRTTWDVRYKDTIHIGGRYFNNRKTLDIYVESDSRKRALKIASERYGAIIAGEQTMYPYLRVGVLIYCAFVLHRWEPDVELEPVNGNIYDVRPQNLRPKQKPIPPEWAERMKARAKVYDSNFSHVCWSVNYLTGYDIQTCKDFAQQAFIYLCTDGFKQVQHCTDIVGLWVKIARFRAFDYMHHVTHRQVYDAIDYMGNRDTDYEFDLFSLLPGEKMQLYTRLYFEGNTPTEIAKEYNVHLGTVSSAVTRSVQYLREYLKKEAV